MWGAIAGRPRYPVHATDYPAPCGLVGTKGRHVRPLEPSHPHARAPGGFPGVSMSPWSALLAGLSARRVSQREVQAEAFFLGNRHKGEIREGAQRELLAPGLSPDRAALLRAVIRMTPRTPNRSARP